MGKTITSKVTWVGKVDWELRRFHGNEYSTWKGSTYNSYLIRDEKVALIDTVYRPFAEEFVKGLREEIDLSDIDYIVANHGEIDHSGALPELMKHIPHTPVYCTANGMKSLKGHYHGDWNFVTVKTGDTLDLGETKLRFVEAPMLHWPDSMFCYLSGENILFSNDAFGQHYATEALFNDLVDQGELWTEAMKYYANILTPFSRLVTKKIEEVLDLDLPLDMICPSHGVIWREDPAQIVKAYLGWADAYKEDQISVVYDSMWGATSSMALAIAQGILDEDPRVTVKLMNASLEDKNDIITEIFRSKTLLLGSPTVNRGLLHSVAALLEMIKGLGFKGKNAATFGSYGWGSESPGKMGKALGDAGFTVPLEGLKAQWMPDERALSECRDYGRAVARLNNG